MQNSDDIAFSHHLNVVQVADFFVQQDALRDEPDVTPMKLQKLLYLAQANYLASANERLFDEPVEAHAHGPVVHRAWQVFPGQQIIATQTTLDFASRADERLPLDVETFLGEVWSKYRDWSASQFRNLAHLQDPWKNHYRADAYRTQIPDDEMTHYFRQSVAASERVFHSNVVGIPAGFIESFDDDEAVAAFNRFMRA
ncbi:putative phage-associated protein [Rhodoglobus vestalii]|uniref:Putative phage-associated protein n=1 Tax=Rhodoglobus vestalii TaxID=193384 RepID=A0A8H2K8K6_9MICO|nr:type II toxin-antitoxin system antitoxin SocA domain-containing protein [Rhodoglobus vestalii]TQO20659.1 putative phage-associated protein [Rhodoglobus vestalii]